MKINKIIFVLLIIPYFAYSQTDSSNQKIFSRTHYIQLKNKIYSPDKYQIILSDDGDNCKKRKYLIDKNLKTIAKILLPPIARCSDFSGLALNGIMEDKKGFRISIEYGSRYYYIKTFYFKYFNKSFYLYQIQTESFDKNNPEIWKRKNKIISPNIKATKLDLEKYLTIDNMGLK